MISFRTNKLVDPNAFAKAANQATGRTDLWVQVNKVDNNTYDVLVFCQDETVDLMQYKTKVGPLVSSAATYVDPIGAMKKKLSAATTVADLQSVLNDIVNILGW